MLTHLANMALRRNQCQHGYGSTPTAFLKSPRAMLNVVFGWHRADSPVGGFQVKDSTMVALRDFKKADLLPIGRILARNRPLI